MKKLLLLSETVTHTGGISFSKIWRVDSYGGVTANFTKLESDHYSAGSGNCVYPEHPATSYATAGYCKKRIIIGKGYLLDRIKFEDSM